MQLKYEEQFNANLFHALMNLRVFYFYAHKPLAKIIALLSAVFSFLLLLKLIERCASLLNRS